MLKERVKGPDVPIRLRYLVLPLLALSLFVMALNGSGREDAADAGANLGIADAAVAAADAVGATARDTLAPAALASIETAAGIAAPAAAPVPPLALDADRKFQLVSLVRDVMLDSDLQDTNAETAGASGEKNTGTGVGSDKKNGAEGIAETLAQMTPPAPGISGNRIPAPRREARDSAKDLYKLKTVRVSSGDTLMSLLTAKASVPVGEAHQAIESLRSLYDPRKLKPGNAVKVLFRDFMAPSGALSETTDEAEFAGIRIEKDGIRSVTVLRQQDGSYSAEEKEKPLFRKLRAAHVTIENSLYGSAAREDVPGTVVAGIIKAYSWNIDFQRDIQPGDRLEVLYEQQETEDGIASGAPGLLFAKLMLSGTEHSIYRYQMADGTIDFFEPDGQSVRKALLTTPIDGARMSSGFGMRRHPVLGYSKMHKGVDFAAPRGTPVYAAGDGTVEKAGRYSSYGNYVRIRHHDGLKTAYAHLHKFSKGLHAGKRVKQGEIIGYVGSTGRSTGPHLHYELLVGGAQVNPKTVKLPKGYKLKGKELASFKGVMEQTRYDFETIIAGKKRGVVLAANTGGGRHNN